MFSAAFLVQALLASAAFALPSSKDRLASRRARRSGDVARTRQSKPVNIITSPQVSAAVGNASHPEFSSNWAGAVLVASTVSNIMLLVFPF